MPNDILIFGGTRMNERLRKLATEKGYKLSDMAESISFYEDVLGLINLNITDSENGKAKLIYTMHSEEELEDYILWVLHQRDNEI